MAQNITGLGPKEAEFLVRMATSENGIFTAEKARDFWGGSEYTKKTLHRLTNKGWIQRLAHGTYMVIPFEAGPERLWSGESSGNPRGQESSGSDLHSWCFGNSGKGELLGRSGCVCFFLAGSEVLAMTLLMVE